MLFHEPTGGYLPMVTRTASGALLRACERETPGAVLLLGDCDLTVRPLRHELEALWRMGIPVWYVVGNHEADSQACWENLVGDHPEGNLGNRVTRIAGLRVAGLGGTFEAPLWAPKKGVESRFRTKEDMLASLLGHPFEGTLSLKVRASVAPADLDILLDQEPADVLICHEARARTVTVSLSLTRSPKLWV